MAAKAAEANFFRIGMIRPKARREYVARAPQQGLSVGEPIRIFQELRQIVEVDGRLKGGHDDGIGGEGNQVPG